MAVLDLDAAISCFECLPVETIVKRRQKEYYDALSKPDKPAVR
jgi:hypothetical protein